MSKFIFNFDGTVGRVLSSATRDEELTYTGDDYIVWDRVNSERLQRGLPGLGVLGFPRPAVISGQPPQTFEVQGPPGATVEQAREIFNKQLNTGSLVGLVPGEVLSAATQAISGLDSAVSQLGSLRLASLRLPTFDLSDVSVSSAITAASFVQQQVPNFSLGNLDSSDLQGLLAQAAALTAQSADQISAEAGIGKFGLDIDKLESTGFIKPGIASAFAKRARPEVSQQDIDEAARINAEGGDITPEQVSRNRQLNSFLTPSAFTGKAGVSGLLDILSDTNIQNKIQGDVLKNSYQSLLESGLVETLQDPKQLAAALQTAATFGIATAEKFAKGQLSDNIAKVKSVAKAAEYAKSFATKFSEQLSSGSPLETGIKRPQGATKTVNRTTVNASVTSILGNLKIPTPTFMPRASADSTADDVRLTYTGSDPIVWDRVNTARLRAGLPGLDEIGLPRPR